MFNAVPTYHLFEKRHARVPIKFANLWLDEIVFKEIMVSVPAYLYMNQLAAKLPPFYIHYNN